MDNYLEVRHPGHHSRRYVDFSFLKRKDVCVCTVVTKSCCLRSLTRSNWNCTGLYKLHCTHTCFRQIEIFGFCSHMWRTRGCHLTCSSLVFMLCAGSLPLDISFFIDVTMYWDVIFTHSKDKSTDGANNVDFKVSL